MYIPGSGNYPSKKLMKSQVNLGLVGICVLYEKSLSKLGVN